MLAARKTSLAHDLITLLNKPRVTELEGITAFCVGLIPICPFVWYWWQAALSVQFTHLNFAEWKYLRVQRDSLDPKGICELLSVVSLGNVWHKKRHNRSRSGVESERAFEISYTVGLSVSKILKWFRENKLFSFLCTIAGWILCAFSTLI